MVSDVDNNNTSLSPVSTIPPSSSAAVPGCGKKRRKRKTSSTAKLAVGTASLPSPLQTSSTENTAHRSSENAQTDEQWRQRLSSLKMELKKCQDENRILISDLNAAIAKARDAENAEAVVNKGLLSARSLITQRDRAVAELKKSVAELKAQVSEFQEEKKKTDNRLILLKTVSVNLQQAREENAILLRKLETILGETASAKLENEALQSTINDLKHDLESVQSAKCEFAKRELQFDEESELLKKELEDARAQEVKAFGVGAVGMLAVGLSLRLVLHRRRDERE